MSREVTNTETQIAARAVETYKRERPAVDLAEFGAKPEIIELAGITYAAIRDEHSTFAVYRVQPIPGLGFRLEGLDAAVWPFGILRGHYARPMSDRRVCEVMQTLELEPPRLSAFADLLEGCSLAKWSDEGMRAVILAIAQHAPNENLDVMISAARARQGAHNAEPTRAG